VHLDERENTREALEKLREAVEGGGVRPVVKGVVPFSEAARAFEDSGDGVVVRVLEA
jgi:NADPH:quinone reductase-like Zn-dependent oxidoreductase